ncbi:carboxymuconolactone decarboxylase family protein [Undibacterium sp. TJN19]|uniref:carboxymuconolactone decarboxylase family protein n=1 Tax=Undibacterium sp. TJN19 TaxID=3413055 RepID=UPI003BF0125E
MRTCARCGSEYEWGVHVTLFADKAGLSKADITATLQDVDDASAMPASELSMLKAVDQLHDDSQIDDAAWAELAQHFTSAQIVEIITLTGSYHTISFTTNALKIELEDFAARFAQYR